MCNDILSIVNHKSFNIDIIKICGMTGLNRKTIQKTRADEDPSALNIFMRELNGNRNTKITKMFNLPPRK